MSELIDRLSARTMSDLKRGVTFRDGMAHFVQLITETLAEIDRKTEKMEEIARRMEAKP